MHIQILSESARSKHPIPATIEKAIATVKPKARVVYAQPGRYVLKSRTGLFSIFRISKEAKYTPSMKNKLFAQREMEALAGDGLWDIDPDGPYDEPISDLEAEALSFEEDFLRAKGIVVDEDEDIESESAAPARGKGNVGSKMGRKKRAPGMLAPGWHVFNQPASGGPMRKYYAGPRIAARRIAGIMNGEEVPEGRKKSPNETASKTRKARVTKEPKAKVKSIPASAVKEEVTKLTEGKTLKQMENSLHRLSHRRIAPDPKVIQGLKKAISRQQNKVNKAQKKIHNLSFQIVQIENILKNSQDLTPAKIAKFKKGLESRKAKMKEAEQEAKQANNGKALPMRKKSVSKPASKKTDSKLRRGADKQIKEYEAELERQKSLLETLKDDLEDESIPEEAKEIRAEIKDTKAYIKDLKINIKDLKEGGPLPVKDSKTSKATKSKPDLGGSRLDNPSQNKGQSYNEWKASVTKAYGRGVKFVSYDVPSSGVSAELKGKLVDYYSLDLDSQASEVSKLSGDYVDFYESSHKKAVTKALTDSLKDAKLASTAKIAESGATLDVRIKGTKSEAADDVFKVVLSKLKEIGKEKKAAFQYKVERSNGRISGMKIYSRETKAAKSSVKRV